MSTSLPTKYEALALALLYIYKQDLEDASPETYVDRYLDAKKRINDQLKKQTREEWK